MVQLLKHRIKLVQLDPYVFDFQKGLLIINPTYISGCGHQAFLCNDNLFLMQYNL
ncbi:hypothetical protein Hanom_Chr03g00241561 [Helianthus anomalus]